MAINPASSLVNSVASSASSGVNPRTWGFTETLRGAMEQSEQAQGTADTQVGELMQGGGMDVHTAMIAVEKADLSFQLMMQVRNKIVAAYKEISGMQL